jgi:hypothetical protein
MAVIDASATVSDRFEISTKPSRLSTLGSLSWQLTDAIVPDELEAASVSASVDAAEW